MTTSSYPLSVAFAPENPSGTGPADGPAWVSDGNRIAVVSESVDLSVLIQAVAENLATVDDPFDVRQVVKALKEGELPTHIYASGAGVTTAPSSQIVETGLMKVLKNAMGGLDRGTTLVAAGAGHDTNKVEFADASSLAVGGHLAMVVDGIGYPRRIVDIDANVVTVDQDFPETPENDDVFSAMATVYVDAFVLFDSRDGGGSGPHTLAWIYQAGQSDALETFLLHGCRLELGNLTLPRGEIPTFEFTNHYASFTPPHLNPPNPGWTSEPEHPHPFAIGPDCEVWLQDYGTSTSSPLAAPAEVTFEPGVPVVRIPSVTENEVNMAGTRGYASQPANTTVTMNMAGFDPDLWADFDTGQMKSFRYAKNAAPGGIFCLTMPRAEIYATPNRSTVESVSSNNLVLRAHRDLVTVGTSQLARSKFSIAVG